MPEPSAVVIVGGGFGGLTAALALAEQPQHPPLLLVEPNERFLFLPLLYELLSGELRRWEIAPAYDELLAGRGVAWRRDWVSSIDTTAQRVQTRGGLELGYSQLVIATGGKPQDYGIPGVAEHALGFRSLADVERLQALVEELRQRRRPLQRLAVVGAGASGVELACKLADLLDGAAVVELVEQGSTLLPQSKAFNREQAKLALQRCDIRLRLSTCVAAVHADGLELLRAGPQAGGLERLQTDAVIWTAGISPCLPAITPPPPLDQRGRLLCNADLSVVGRPEVFALGDAAHCPLEDDESNGSAHPATAQVAYQQAQQLAVNLSRRQSGQEALPFQWKDLGEMVGLGVGQASITGMGLTLAGPAAYQLRKLGYLARLPGLKHQLRVAAGWLSDWR